MNLRTVIASNIESQISRRSLISLALVVLVALLQSSDESDKPAIWQKPRSSSGGEAKVLRSAAPGGAFAAAERLREHGGEASLRSAATLYRRVIEGSQASGDLAAEAESWSQLADVKRSLGDLQGALVSFRAAIVRFRLLGQQSKEVESLNSQGRVFRLLGRLDQAGEVYGRALTLSREIGFRPGEAVALNNLGMLFYYTGEVDRALPALRGALELWLELGMESRAATALSNVGSVYLLVGRLDAAAEVLQRSLVLARSTGDQSLLATTLTELGWCRHLQKRYRVAIPLFEQAIELRRLAGDRLGEAGALDRLGSALRELGNFGRSYIAYRQALAILVESGSLIGQAHTLANLCQLQLAQAETQSAGQSCERALAFFRKTGDRNGEAHALYLRALVLKREGRLEEAAVSSGEAIELVDALWARGEERAQRTSYLEARYGYYESYISILMDLHQRHPRRGFDLLAFQASERARSRNLLEALLRPGFARGELHPEELRLPPASGEFMPEFVDLTAASGGDRRSIIEAASRSRLLNVEKIRAALLRPETLLVVYFVGERASYVWWLDENSFGSHRLPGRKILEGLTRKLRVLLANPMAEATQTLLALDSVGRLLLGPIPIRDEHRRLVLILDGPLHYLPFGAFSAQPEHTTGGASTDAFLEGWRPLLTERDLVVLPSVSVLGALRQRRNTGRKTLAVLADPVFSAEDERVGGPGMRSAASRVSATMPILAPFEDLRRSAEDFGLDGWRRLAGTRAEAIRIASLVAPGEQFTAFDFAARRELALSGSLADYRIVHFATHSLLQEEEPDLSGIVLSLVDERGQPQDGLLSVKDVLQMKLSAELVVLSGCRTALGRETHGEGMLGLAQSFLVAGARSLLVSLWDLDDEATSELMARFYRGLLVRGLSPSQALRAAQISVRAEERFSAPYYWAPFILVGAAEGFSNDTSLNNS